MRKFFRTIFVVYCFFVGHTYSAESFFPADIKFKNYVVDRSSCDISGYISFWKLPENAVLPQVISKNIPIKIQMKKPSGPGFTDIKKTSASVSGELSFNADMEFYYICANDDIKCEKAYFSIQIKLSGDVKAYCGSYHGYSDFIPFPVVFCSGYKDQDRLGITLHRIKY